MAFIGNGITLTTKMLKELANGAVVLSLDGATNNVSIGVQYDNATIKVNGSNQLMVGAIAISNVTDLQSTITGINDRIESLETGTVDLSNYTNETNIKIVTVDNADDDINGGFYANKTSASLVVNESASAGAAFELTASGIVYKVNEGSVFSVTPAGVATLGSNTVLTSADKNVNNGVAGLDANGKLLVANIPVGNGIDTAGSNIAVKAGTGITVDAGGVNLAVATDSAIGGVKVAAAATSGG